MKIGNIEVPHGLFLGPMAGFSDSAMRRICKEFGAEYLVTEMISAKAVCYNDKKTLQLAKIEENELPCSLQLFGHEPEFIEKAIEILNSEGKLKNLPTAYDINMGCPVQKIVSSGDGSALMKNPSLVEKIVLAAKKQKNAPVTVKIRAGWDFSSLNAPEIAKAAEAGGADAIFIHGRTKTQMYSGEVNLSIIKKVKESVKIPVIGNGDIVDLSSAKNMLDQTGVDGIMIGRGAVGNPFVFKEIQAFFTNKSFNSPTWDEKREIALKQLRYACEDKGEEIAVKEARKQLPAYLHNMSNSSKVRLALSTASTYGEVSDILMSFNP